MEHSDVSGLEGVLVGATGGHTVRAEAATEIAAGERFAFGENWSRFLADLSEERIQLAEQSLRAMLKVESLVGKRFLDAGSGSGLFSLAARRLGASVRSFDFDPKSVACTQELRRRYFTDDAQWKIEQGSVLDREFMRSLGRYDVVYSWGVLHHTGEMYAAFSTIADAVAPQGKLFIAIYNDQKLVSRYWRLVKRIFNGSAVGKISMTGIHTPYLLGVRWLTRTLTGRRSLERGMSLWYDMFDWLGGYPFEVAKPEDVFRFFRDAGYALSELTTCGGRTGCNQFVFTRES